MKTFQSTPITFIDQTDSRKLEVYITSNLPTVQIFNGNSGAYTPDWTEGEKLVLSMDVFLDSRTMTTAEYNGTTIKWYKNDVEMSDGSIEDISDDKRKITIKDNILKDNAIITYTCEATYQGIVASTRITFTRIDSGLNGEAGTDGTSVKILGTASSVAKVTNTNYYTITYSEGTVVAAALGDSYVYNGDLYVCSVLNGDGNNDYFVNVGPIQGEPGEPAKSIVLTGSSQVFRVDKDGKISPPIVTITAHTVNLTAEQAQSIKWEYRYNASGVWNDIANGASTLGGDISRKNNVVTINGDKLNQLVTSNESVMSVVFRATFEDAEDVLTIYKTFDGEKGDTASMAFLTNENISFSANANGEVITGVPPITINVVAYNGPEKVMPEIGTITDIPDGMTITVDKTSLASLSKEIILILSVGEKKNFGSPSSNYGVITVPVISPVSTALKLSWSKINAGPEGKEGVGIEDIQVDYGSSTTSTVKVEDISWSKTIPVVPEGEYLWTRTTINYTDSKKQDTVTYTYVQQGKRGDTGTFVDDADIQYAAGSDATTPPSSGWSTAVVATTTDKRYLWTRTIFKLSDGTAGDPVYSVAKQGQDGRDGAGASLVDITPSALYFKSTTGSTGTFTPQYIYLYPRFQNATYNNWQYSCDGGSTWSSATGANGLSIGTYNSVANSLRVDRSSTLYTNDITSISFRCNSTTTNVYDTVSIVKIYDVVDLQIGGRNLLKGTGTPGIINSTGGTNATGVFYDLSIPSSEIQGKETMISFDWEYIGSTPSGHFIVQTGAPQYSGLNKTFYIDSTNTSGHFESTWTPLTTSSFEMMFFRCDGMNGTLKVTNMKLERGNMVTDWSPAPEDLIEEAANINVMLSNEAHFFEASPGGVPKESSIVLDVVGYKGSVRSATTVGTITGIPSSGMAVTVSDNGTTNTKLTVAITPALTSDVADYGILTIPITVNDHTLNKVFSWTKAKAGDVGLPGSDAITFQVYSNNGYALSTSVPTIVLQTFAYIGDVEIKAGATYQWYRHNGTDWVAISGATNDYFNVSRDDVSFSNNYMCKMYFSNTEYVGVVTIEDKNDEHRVFASKPSNYFAGDLWVVGNDYIPSEFVVGSMLRAAHTNATYADSDWELATRYDKEIDGLKSKTEEYGPYFSINEDGGLRVDDATINDNTLYVGRVETTTINTKEANIESPLTVSGRYSGSKMLQAPIINLGNFSLVVESNGSLSIIANT
jgi:hypothetical protein